MRVPTVSPAVYRRITVITLASLVFIMVTGAAVRLTGSGLGCSDWPTCEESSLVPRAASGSEGWVEFGNRLVTGLVMVFTLAAVLGARWRSPRRDDLFRWSLGLPVWVMGNAVVGALVVWLELAPVSVIGHFLLSLGAVWNAVVLHHKAGEAGEDVDAAVPEPGPDRRAVAVPAMRRLCDALLAAGAVALVTGTIVTGSGPHAGDEEAERLGFEVADVARIHGIAVIVFGLLTLLALWWVRRGDAAPIVERRLQQLLGVLFVQGAIGYTQYFAGVPAWLVAIHVLGAAMVWIALVRVRLALTEPVAAPSATASSVARERVETAA